MTIIHYYILNYMKLFQIMGAQKWMIMKLKLQTTTDFVTTGDAPWMTCGEDWETSYISFPPISWSIFIPYVCFPTNKNNI